MRQLIFFSMTFMLPLTAFAEPMSVNFKKPVQWTCPARADDPTHITDAITNATLSQLQIDGKGFTPETGEWVSLDDRTTKATDRYKQNAVEIRFSPPNRMSSPQKTDRFFSCRVDYTINKASGRCWTRAAKLSKCTETTKTTRATASIRTRAGTQLVKK